MYKITINSEICQKCGRCSLSCPVGVIQQSADGMVPVVSEGHLSHCFGCGHCAAVCPQGAIDHSRYPEGSVQAINTEVLPTYESVLELVRSRRSKRTFSDKPVERELLEQVIDAARFAPSGHNAQSTEFVVVQDKDKIHQIGQLTADGLRKMAVPFTSPIGKLMMNALIGKRATEHVSNLAPEFETLASQFENGNDILLHEPPVLILFCADSVGGTMTATNANIALQNATLAAEAMGLGTFYTGFVVTVSERNDSIAKFVGLPETHKIFGALAIGYPELKYQNWPERNAAKVTWIGEN